MPAKETLHPDEVSLSDARIFTFPKGTLQV